MRALSIATLSSPDMFQEAPADRAASQSDVHRMGLIKSQPSRYVSPIFELHSSLCMGTHEGGLKCSASRTSPSVLSAAPSMVMAAGIDRYHVPAAVGAGWHIEVQTQVKKAQAPVPSAAQVPVLAMAWFCRRLLPFSAYTLLVACIVPNVAPHVRQHVVIRLLWYRRSWRYVGPRNVEHAKAITLSDALPSSGPITYVQTRSRVFDVTRDAQQSNFHCFCGTLAPL